MANPDPLKANTAMQTEFNLSAMLDKKYDNGLTGRESIDKMKQILSSKGASRQQRKCSRGVGGRASDAIFYWV